LKRRLNMATKAPAKKAAKVTRALPARAGASSRAGLNIEEDPSDKLAIRQDDDMAAPAGAQEFTDAPVFGRSDLLMPNLKLGQGLTPEVANGEAEAGDWILIGHDPEKEVVVIPMQYGAGRSLQEEGDFAVLCSSKDRVRGEGTHGPGSKENKTGLCSNCPMSQWGAKGRDGKSKPPKCSEYYLYAVYSVTHQAQALITLRKTAINTAKQLNTIIAQKKLGNFAIKLGSTMKTSGARQYHVPTIAIATKVGEDEFETARAMFGR
jgi:hypothetical protein